MGSGGDLRASAWAVCVSRKQWTGPMTAETIQRPLPPALPPSVGVLARHRHVLVLIPLLVSVMALVFTDFNLRRQEEVGQAAEFNTYAEKLNERLRERIGTFDEILRGAAGFFMSSDEVSRQEWRSYVSSLALEESHVGIQGLGFAQYLPPQRVPAHVKAVRAEGFPDYEVTPSGARQDYSAIVYLEPFYGRNLRAFGFDMLSEPVRREAMLRARDSAEIAYSGRVKLKQESSVDVQFGTLAYLPVYRHGLKPRSVAQRRTDLVGWVYSPFRMRDMVSAVLREDLKTVRVRLSDVGGDGDAQGGEALLFDSQAGEAEAAARAPSRLQVTLPLQVGGRTWRVQFEPLPSYRGPDRQIYRTLAMAGVALTGALLCALTWVLLYSRERANAMAREMASTISEGEERFRLMVEGVKDYAILMLDERGTVMSWNAGAARIKGWQAEEIIGQHIGRFYTEEDRQAGAPDKALAVALITGQYSEEGWRVRKGGEVFRASVRITAMRDAQGHIKGFAKVTRDITAHHQQEERLRLAATVFRSTQEGVAITDAEGRVLAVNPAFERVTEYTEAEVVRRNLNLLASGRHDRGFFQTMWRDITEVGAWQGEIWNRRKGGEIYPGWLTISAVRNEAGHITNFVGVFTDITRITHAETQMEHLAHHDALTDLPNRLLLRSRLAHTLERAHRTERICAVMFLDLDRFKAVNDQFGHEAGDELLKSAAQRLRLHLRENDTVARLGGDEFVIVLEDLASVEGAEVVARAIIERMQQPFHLPGGQDACIGCSVGISVFPDDGSDGETLVRHADTALYQAKEAGKGTWRLYRGGRVG